MGHKIQNKIYRLNFQGSEDLDGATIRMKGCTIGEFNEVLGHAGSGDSESMRENNEWMISFMAEKLLTWDLEYEDGSPVPADITGIRSMDFSVLNEIVTAYQLAAAGIPNLLQKLSENGRSSQEAQLGMAAESLSPGSWPEQS